MLTEQCWPLSNLKNMYYIYPYKNDYMVSVQKLNSNISFVSIPENKY